MLALELRLYVSVMQPTSQSEEIKLDFVAIPDTLRARLKGQPSTLRMACTDSAVYRLPPTSACLLRTARSVITILLGVGTLNSTYATSSPSASPAPSEPCQAGLQDAPTMWSRPSRSSYVSYAAALLVLPETARTAVASRRALSAAGSATAAASRACPPSTEQVECYRGWERAFPESRPRAARCQV